MNEHMYATAMELVLVGLVDEFFQPADLGI